MRPRLNLVATLLRQSFCFPAVLPPLPPGPPTAARSDKETAKHVSRPSRAGKFGKVHVAESQIVFMPPDFRWNDAKRCAGAINAIDTQYCMIHAANRFSIGESCWSEP